MKGLGPTVLLLAAVVCALWFLLGDGIFFQGPADSGSLLDEHLSGGTDLRADEPADPQPMGGPITLGVGATRDATDRSAGDLELKGRVVDGRRRPIAGAVVRLERGGARVRSATTDAAGGYVLLVPARGGGRQRAVLVGRAENASAREGRIGTAVVWLPPGGGTLLAPTLVLEAGVVLELRVVRDGSPVPGAQVAVTQRLAAAPVVLASQRADAEGRLLLHGLPVGAVEVFAGAPGSGRGHVEVLLPRPAGGPLDIVLGPERQVEVLVVDAATEVPIAGAEVLPGDALTMPDPHGPGYLPFASGLRTDRTGRARIVGVPTADLLYVNARAPGYALTPWWQGRGRIVQQGGAKGAAAPRSEIRIALSRYRTVTFPVSTGGVAPPADGTQLRVQITGAGRRTAGAALGAVMRAGALEVRGLPNRPLGGVVVAPSGAQGLFRAPAGVELGGVVRFHTVREVQVRVVSPEGNVLPDVALRLDPLGKGADISPATTDERGIARFLDVGPDLVAVRLALGDRPSAGALLGKLDLRQEEDVYEVSLQPRASFLIDVRIGGDARLPGRYTLTVGQQRVGAGDLEEDPELGRLRVWVRPPMTGGALELALHAHDYLPVRASVLPSAEVEAQVTFELEAAGSLVVVVTPSEDGTQDVRLQRFDQTGAGWETVIEAGVDASLRLLGTGGARMTGAEQVFEGLSAGRYRVIDRRSGSVSGDVAVAPGSVDPGSVDPGSAQTGRVAPRVHLDLSGAVWLKGHVRAPVGTNLAMARVLVEGRDEPGSIWAGARADAGGAFRVRALRGETLALRVVHPTLSAARTGGRVSARPGAGEVELRLEEAAQARFRLVGFEQVQTPTSGAWYAPLRVHLFLGAAREPTRVLQPTAQAGLFTFGGFEPGTYRVLLVFGATYAPLSLAKVALGGGLTELGSLTPSLGETLRVRWRTALPEGASIWATASHEGQPPYVRRAKYDKGAGELLFSGLGAGTFQLEVRGANLVPGSSMSSTLLAQRIVLDGKGETAIEVALR